MSCVQIKVSKIIRARGLLRPHNSNYLLNSPQPPTADPSLVTLISGASAASLAHSPMAQGSLQHNQDATDPGFFPPTK